MYGQPLSRIYTEIHYQTITSITNQKQITMKKAIQFFAAAAILSIAFSSCTSHQGLGYANHLRNKKSTCMNSDFGCGWANKGQR
jgi:hypothetical protein